MGANGEIARENPNQIIHSKDVAICYEESGEQICTSKSVLENSDYYDGEFDEISRDIYALLKNLAESKYPKNIEDKISYKILRLDFIKKSTINDINKDNNLTTEIKKELIIKINQDFNSIIEDIKIIKAIKKEKK